MPLEGVPKLKHEDLLTLEQIAALAQWIAPRVGIERIKITGGEPLIRRDVDQLIRQLVTIPGVAEVSLTTNGARLAQEAANLKAAGLARVNVSLDSLDPARFRELTRGGQLHDTLNGISAAVAAGLTPIKLNSVLQRSTWQVDVPLLLDYATERKFEVRFIELMRTGTERAWCDSEFVSAADVQRWLAERAQWVPLALRGNGPARSTLVCWRDSFVAVGWIAPRSHPFCQGCERLRLDARGRLFRCLMDSRCLDLPSILGTCGDHDAERQLADYLAAKTIPTTMDHAGAMNLIGG